MERGHPIGEAVHEQHGDRRVAATVLTHRERDAVLGGDGRGPVVLDHVEDRARVLVETPALGGPGHRMATRGGDEGS